jgi:hypothetical protein
MVQYGFRLNERQHAVSASETEEPDDEKSIE